MRGIIITLVLFVLTPNLSGQTAGIKMYDLQLQSWRGNFYGNMQWKRRNINEARFNGIFNHNIFSEELQLKGKGSIYHPNLVSFNLSAALGFNHGRIYQKADKVILSQNRGFFRKGIFRGTFLQRKPYRISLNYQRDFRQLNRDFFSDVDESSRRWSVQTGWQNALFPVAFNYSSDDRLEDYSIRLAKVKEKRLVGSVSWKGLRRTDGKLRLGRTFLHRTEEGYYDFRQTNAVVQMNFSYLFDPLKNRNYQSSFYWNQLAGTSPLTSVIWRNHINKIDWGKNLSTNYTFSTRTYKTPESTSRTHVMSALLTHQLYQSLTSTAQLKVTFFTEGDFKQKEWQFPLQWNYKKRVPYGMLLADLKIQPEWEQIQSKTGMFRQGEYTHSFAQGNPVLLPRKGILVETIQLTSSDGLIVYVLDLDYQVYPYEELVQVVRLPGSSIPESEEVIIRYSFQGEPSSKMFSTVWNYGISYRIHGYYDFMVGYKGSATRYSLAKETYWWTLDQRTLHQWFVQANYAPVSGEFTREIFQSQVVPYRSTTVSINLILGSFISQYLLVRGGMVWQTLELNDDLQRQYHFALEYFRRFSRTIRGKIVWGQRRMWGDFNQLQEQKWEAIIKYETNKGFLSVAYEQKLNTFFQERELDRRCIIKTSIQL